jgi:hypothetical protein
MIDWQMQEYNYLDFILFWLVDNIFIEVSELNLSYKVVFGAQDRYKNMHKIYSGLAT